MVRFLEKSEFGRTVPLFEQCFGKDPEFEAEYYGDDVHAGEVFKGRIAVLEEDGRILSMVHLKPVLAEYGPAEFGPAECAEALSGRTAPGEGAAGAAVPAPAWPGRTESGCTARTSAGKRSGIPRRYIPDVSGYICPCASPLLWFLQRAFMHNAQLILPSR